MTRVKRLTPFVLLSTHQVVTSRCGRCSRGLGEAGTDTHGRSSFVNQRKNGKALKSSDREGVWCDPLPQKKRHQCNVIYRFFFLPSSPGNRFKFKNVYFDSIRYLCKRFLNSAIYTALKIITLNSDVLQWMWRKVSKACVTNFQEVKMPNKSFFAEKLPDPTTETPITSPTQTPTATPTIDPSTNSRIFLLT